MDIRQFRQFIAVAEDLNFRRAAARLKMAQPPLSQAIKAMESELGVRLFERSNREVKLTSAGSTFLVEARRTVAQMDRSMSLARQVGAGQAGVLRIAFISSATFTVLPTLLGTFHGRFPEVEFELNESYSIEILRLLQADQIDVGILRPIQGLELGKFRTSVLQRERYVAAVPGDHRFARRKSVKLSELASDRFITFSARRGPALYQQSLMACRSAGFTPRVVHQASQVPSLVAMVSAGLGVALVPSSAEYLRHPNVRFLALDGPSAHLTLEILVACREGEDMPVRDKFFSVARKLKIS